MDKIKWPVFLEFLTITEFSKFARYAKQNKALKDGFYSTVDKTAQFEFDSKEDADYVRKSLKKNLNSKRVKIV